VAQVQLFIHQYPQVLLDRAALNPFIPQGKERDPPEPPCRRAKLGLPVCSAAALVSGHLGKGGTNMTARSQGMNEEGAASVLADFGSCQGGPGAAVQWLNNTFENNTFEKFTSS